MDQHSQVNICDFWKCQILLSVVFVTVTPALPPNPFASYLWARYLKLVLSVLDWLWWCRWWILALLNIVSVGFLRSSSLTSSQILPWSLIPCLCVWLLFSCLRSRLCHLSRTRNLTAIARGQSNLRISAGDLLATYQMWIMPWPLDWVYRFQLSVFRVLNSIVGLPFQ